MLKNIIIILLAAVIIVISVKYYFSSKEVKVVTNNIITAAKKDFAVALNKSNGRTTTPSGQNTFTKSQVPDSILKNTTIDSLSKELKIKTDEVTHWQQVSISIKGEQLKAQKIIDSLGGVGAYYKDAYISIAYANGFFDYSENFKLNQIEYPSKKFLWIKYANVIDLSTDNPRAQINSFKTFTVVPNPPNWTLKVQGGANYNISTKTLTPVAQLNIGYKDWNFTGGFVYTNTINSFIGVNYSFISLK